MNEVKDLKEVLLTDSLQFNYTKSVAGNRIYLRKFPLTNQFQKNLNFQLKTSPPCAQTSFIDRFGNKTMLLSRSQPHSSLRIDLSTKVALRKYQKQPAQERTLSISVWQKKKIPPELEEFCLESARVNLTPVTRRIAETLARNSQNDWEKTVLAIRYWVAQQMRYKLGATETTTLSSDALRLRHGVCQDITHVFLSLVRSLRIPARYVSGYQVGGTEMHSWAEIYFPASPACPAPNRAAGRSRPGRSAGKPTGEWRTFDPTEQSDGLPKIAVATGRDYQDAQPISGNFYSAEGKGELVSKIKVEWLGV